MRDGRKKEKDPVEEELYSKQESRDPVDCGEKQREKQRRA
jgi:hypothetical protein